MARGHRRNTSIVLAAVHGLSGLFRAVSAAEPSLFRPLPPPVPVPNNPSRFCGRTAKCTCSVPFPTVSLQRQVVSVFAVAACVHLRGEPVSSYFSMACCSVVSH